MPNEDYCPKDRLVDLLEGLLNFENLEEEPWECKKHKFMVGGKTLDDFMEHVGMDMDKVNKRRVGDYVQRQNVLSDLLRYGNTKEEILGGLRTHVKICSDCFEKYLDYLTAYVDCIMHLKDLEKDHENVDFLSQETIKETIEKAKESFEKGKFYILKEGDGEYLGLFK